MSTLKPEQSEHLIKLLKQRKQTLMETIAQSDQSAQPVKLDQQAFGRVTRVDALQQQSMAKASLEQSKQQLRQVLMALARFESGDYGYCLECDRPIQFARLEIRPESSLCIDCQSGKELADR
ncbi:TraR/DksA family transcriptional regulator [Endozoicomonas elysicola]|nr:TraR/DksA family transcriptional regulator [Endozoicomonas elysicola]